MQLDFVKPRWHQHLVQSDTVFGTDMAALDNMGTLSAPLLTRQPLPDRRELPAGILRVQATALGVIASDWYLGLFDGDAENGGNEPASPWVLQMGTADGTEAVPPTVAFVHLTAGQLNRLSYFAVNTSGNGFSFLLDFWTYEDLEAAARRMTGVEASPARNGCGC